MTKNKHEIKKASVVFLASFFLACGCEKQAAPPQSDLARWSDQAHEDLLEKLTNDVVGLNRIVKCDLNDTDPNPTNWTAEVTAEYINHMGGVDRTNLPYYFRFWTIQKWNHGIVIETNIMAMMDTYKKFQRELREIESAK